MICRSTYHAFLRWFGCGLTVFLWHLGVVRCYTGGTWFWYVVRVGKGRVTRSSERLSLIANLWILGSNDENVPKCCPAPQSQDTPLFVDEDSRSLVLPRNGLIMRRLWRQLQVNWADLLVTDLVPLEIACFTSSLGRINRTAICISRDEIVNFLEYVTSSDTRSASIGKSKINSCLLEASVAMRSKILLTNEFRIAMALFEIPVSGWTCFKTIGHIKHAFHLMRISDSPL